MPPSLFAIAQDVRLATAQRQHAQTRYGRQANELKGGIGLFLSV